MPLIIHFLKIELLNKMTLLSILLYLVSLSYAVFLNASNLNTETWIILFWFSQMFITLLIMGRNTFPFSRKVNYYLNFSSTELFLGQAVVSFLLISLFGILLFLLLSGIFEQLDIPFSSMLVILISTNAGLAVISTFVLFLAGGTSRQSMVLSILAIPIFIPLLIQAIQLTLQNEVLSNMVRSTDFHFILAIDAIVTGMALLLFPSIWLE